MSFIMLLLGFLGLLGTSDGGATTSEASATRANLKQMVNAIESCAAGRIDGAYSGNTAEEPDAPDCLAPETLIEYESAMRALAPTTTTPSRPGQYQVVPIGGEAMGFMVQGTSATSHDKLAYFAELHRPDGTLLKLCSAEPIDPDTTEPPAADGDLDDCEGGTWG